MIVVLKKSPKSEKKFRVEFDDGTHVDFGARGYTDYTKHQNPMRMRSYVRRHGGRVPLSLLDETDPKKVQDKMLGVNKSTKEYWNKKGMKSAGFWSRWLLWSFPTLREAKNYIRKEFKINIKVKGV
jgi:hypothetical protein